MASVDEQSKQKDEDDPKFNNRSKVSPLQVRSFSQPHLPHAASHHPHSSSHLPHSSSYHHYHRPSDAIQIPKAPFTSSHSLHNAASDPTLTLNRAMSLYGGDPGSLPEFTASRGGSCRLPSRAPIHPGRPPALELRPRPLRETQFGGFLRALAGGEKRLWVGMEEGLRCYDLDEVYDGGIGDKRGDEESALFEESEKVSGVTCLAIGVGGSDEVVWSGHKDGKIRCWKVRDGGGFVETVSWQAHKSTILAMVITSYGDIWSSTEGGGIKVWPCESINKLLSPSTQEKDTDNLSIERSYVDLRSYCTVNGTCPLPSSDIKHLIVDHGKSKVWGASSLHFALWDARKRELLKVFDLEGQAVTRVIEASPIPDPCSEEDMKVKVAASTKKEKSQVGFFQRSRNVLMGAAGAVRRAAAKGNSDDRRTEALTLTSDGMIWSGCSNGSLIQWDGNGTRLHEVHNHSHSVKSMCAFGTRLWIGFVSGIIHVMDLEGNLLAGWIAHYSPVINMAVAGLYMFTLANHGGIRGWGLSAPGPIDDILRLELSNKELLYTKQEQIKILCGTWNVGQAKASHDSLITWLGNTVSEVGLVVVGLQEVEMGAGVLAVAAAKESVGLEGSNNGHWWLDAIGKTLDEGSSFDRVGSRQLAGLLICAWARKCIRPHIGDIDAAAVACGFGRAIGNKGAVGLRMRIYDRVFCFVNCHFAAHLEAVSKRNADYDHIYRTMSFSRPSHGIQPPSGVAASSVPSNRGGNAPASNSDDAKPDLSEADMVVFMGDLNYRLHSITYDEARDMVSQRCFDWLREKDQLRAEMKAGKVFQGMREGLITFPPTYKFEKHVVGLSGYDSSEKKRIPAWCDRILYRDSRSVSLAECSLECPVVSSITMYDACMDVTDSDHKPVRCIFNVNIARVDHKLWRKEFGNLLSSNEKIKSLLENYSKVPETIVSTNNIILQNAEMSVLRITNKCDKNIAIFEVLCEGQICVKEDSAASEVNSNCSFAFPHWLQINPAAGIIKPGDIMEVSIHHDEYFTREEFVDGVQNNWWCEDTQDREVVLLVNVRGSFSTVKKTHQIHVRCYTAQQSSSAEGRNSTSSKVKSSHLHRASFSDFESKASDLVQDLCPIRGH